MKFRSWTGWDLFSQSVFLLMILISLYDAKKGVKVKGLEVDTAMFKVSNGFAVGTMIICGVLVALYSIFW